MARAKTNRSINNLFDTDTLFQNFAQKICEKYFTEDELNKAYDLRVSTNYNNDGNQKTENKTLRSFISETFDHSFTRQDFLLEMPSSAKIIVKKAEELGISTKIKTIHPDRSKMGRLVMHFELEPTYNSTIPKSTLEIASPKNKEACGLSFRTIVSMELGFGLRQSREVVFKNLLNAPKAEIDKIFELELTKLLKKPKTLREFIRKKPAITNTVEAKQKKATEPEKITKEDITKNILNRLKEELFSEKQLKTYVDEFLGQPYKDLEFDSFRGYGYNEVTKRNTIRTKYNVLERTEKELTDMMPDFLALHLLTISGVNCAKEMTEHTSKVEKAIIEELYNVNKESPSFPIIRTWSHTDKQSGKEVKGYAGFKREERFREGEIGDLISRMITEELCKMVQPNKKR